MKDAENSIAKTKSGKRAKASLGESAQLDEARKKVPESLNQWACERRHRGLPLFSTSYSYASQANLQIVAGLGKQCDMNTTMPEFFTADYNPAGTTV